MYLAFIDVRGDSGSVTDELTVEYDGEWRTEIDEHVSSVRREYLEGDGELEPKEALQRLVAEMPQELPVTDAELRTEQIQTE